jgi:hypothetical protein
VTGKFRVVAVYDLTAMASLSPGRRELWASETVGPAVAALGGSWQHMIAPTVPVTAVPEMAAAQKVGLPAVVVVGADGVVDAVPVTDGTPAVVERPSSA